MKFDESRFRTLAALALGDIRRVDVPAQDNVGTDLGRIHDYMDVVMYASMDTPKIVNSQLRDRMCVSLYNKLGSAAWAFLSKELNTVPEIDRLSSKFINMLWGKHNDYGLKPLTKWGLWGIFIKIDTKISRLESLIRGTLDEDAIYDTLWDILGYCVLGLIVSTYITEPEKKELRL
jgi:hypothetical protein